MDSDSRKRTRVDGQFDGTLRRKGQTVEMVTENVSLKGLLCQVQQEEHNLHEGDVCTVTISLAADLSLQVEATVVRHRGREIGLDYLGMDEESYAHLRNIVRYAAPDADAIDREQVVPAFEDKT